MIVVRAFFVISWFLQAVIVSAQYNPDTLYRKVDSIHQNVPGTTERLRLIEALTNSFEKSSLPADSVYALMLHRIGLYHSFSKEYIKAINFTKKAAQINTSGAAGCSHSYVAKSFYNIALYYESLYDYKTALSFYNKAVTVAALYPNRTDTYCDGYFGMYNTYASQGNYQEAMNCATRGLNGSHFLSKTNSAYFLLKIGAAAVYIKEFEFAKKNLNKAQPFFLKLHDTANLFFCNQYYADVAIGEGRTPDARIMLENGIRQGSNMTDKYYLATALTNSGLFYKNIEKEFAKSASCFQRVIDLYSGKEDENFLYLSAVNNMGQLAAFQKKPQQALNYFYKAFNLQCGRYAVADTFRNPPLSQLKNIIGEQFTFITLRNKAEYLMMTYKQNHHDKYLQASRQSFRLADSLLTDMRNNQRGEKSKLYWRELSRNFFQQALELCSINHDMEAAFYYMEKSRAVLLNDHLNELGASIKLPPVEAAKEKDLKMIVLEKQLQLSGIRITDEKYQTTLNALLKAQHNLDIFLQETEDKYPAFSQYKYADKVPVLNELQKYLKRTGRQWVQYFVSDTLLFVLYANGSDIKLYRQPVTALEKTLADFYNTCTNKAGQNNQYGNFTKVAANIYDTLLRPLQLKAGSLIISPDNIIFPFDALCTDVASGRMLVQDFAISYAYSARFLLNPITYTTKAKGVFFGMAPVTFPEAMQLPALRSSQAALQALEKYYPDSKMVYEKEATRNQLLKNLADYTIVNLYTHASGGNDSTQPRLFLSDASISLTELQIIQKPATQLVVLSACQTNTGKLASGEGVYTLARGFAMAGIPAAVATLWNADEQTTYFITEQFHKNLSNGLPKDEALQQAKIAWLQQANKEQALPYYWANLTLMGNADKLIKQRNYWWYIAVGIIMLVVAVSWFRYKKLGHKSPPSH